MLARHLSKLKDMRLLTITLCLLTVYFLGWRVLPLWVNAAGPFVFLDEAEYAQMAHAVSVGDFLISGYSQYGPLYPYLLAGLHAVAKVDFYSGGALINLFAWAGSVIFGFRIAGLLGGKAVEQMGGALLMLAAPFWSFGVATWADPLFYLLTYASVFFLLREGRKNGLENRIAMGVVIGLMFLAKTIGLFYIVSLIGTLAIAQYWLPQGDRNASGRPLLHIAQTTICAMIIATPWLIRNFYESGSPLGYSYASFYLKQLFLDEGSMAIAKLVYSFGYQLGYLIFISFGFFGVVIYLWLAHGKRLTRPAWLAIGYLLCAACLVSVISAAHMAPHPAVGYWWPNGRYLTPFGPLFILIGFILLRQATWPRRPGFQIHMIAIFFLQAVFVLLATPLHVVTPAGLMNNPDLGLMFLWDGENIVWRSKHEPEGTQLLLSVVLLLASLLAALASTPWKTGALRAAGKGLAATLPVIAFVLILGGSSVQYELLSVMQGSRAVQNRLFQEAQFLCNDDVYIDERLGGGNLDFVYKFWCPSSEIKTISIDGFGERFDHAAAKPSLLVARKDMVSASMLSRALPIQNPEYVVLVAGD